MALMKIKRKEGLKGIRISGWNTKLFYVILALIIILIGIIIATNILGNK